MASFIQAILSDIFARKSTFTEEDIPDLTGKVVIVTGANTGALVTLVDRQSILLILSS
jgi:hypothetical protein